MVFFVFLCFSACLLLFLCFLFLCLSDSLGLCVFFEIHFRFLGFVCFISKRRSCCTCTDAVVFKLGYDGSFGQPSWLREWPFTIGEITTISGLFGDGGGSS